MQTEVVLIDTPGDLEGDPPWWPNACRTAKILVTDAVELSIIIGGTKVNWTLMGPLTRTPG